MGHDVNRIINTWVLDGKKTPASEPILKTEKLFWEFILLENIEMRSSPSPEEATIAEEKTKIFDYFSAQTKGTQSI